MNNFEQPKTFLKALTYFLLTAQVCHEDCWFQSKGKEIFGYQIFLSKKINHSNKKLLKCYGYQVSPIIIFATRLATSWWSKAQKPAQMWDSQGRSNTSFYVFHQDSFRQIHNLHTQFQLSQPLHPIPFFSIISHYILLPAQPNGACCCTHIQNIYNVLQ